MYIDIHESQTPPPLKKNKHRFLSRPGIFFNVIERHGSLPICQNSISRILRPYIPHFIPYPYRYQ